MSARYLLANIQSYSFTNNHISLGAHKNIDHPTPSCYVILYISFDYQLQRQLLFCHWPFTNEIKEIWINDRNIYTQKHNYM